jgi:hypothetical protein
MAKLAEYNFMMARTVAEIEAADSSCVDGLYGWYKGDTPPALLLRNEHYYISRFRGGFYRIDDEGILHVNRYQMLLTRDHQPSELYQYCIERINLESDWFLQNMSLRIFRYLPENLSTHNIRIISGRYLLILNTPTHTNENGDVCADSIDFPGESIILFARSSTTAVGDYFHTGGVAWFIYHGIICIEMYVLKFESDIYEKLDEILIKQIRKPVQ